MLSVTQYVCKKHDDDDYDDDDHDDAETSIGLINGAIESRDSGTINR